MMTKAENLRCGDVFRFRENLYVCLVTITDRRHTITNVVAVAHHDLGSQTPRIIVLKLLRTFGVEVGNNRELLTLTVLRHTPGEITESMTENWLHTLSIT